LFEGLRMGSRPRGRGLSHQQLVCGRLIGLVRLLELSCSLGGCDLLCTIGTALEG
jgi:hypothetical protein